jgi:hypothetical protein
MKLASRQNRWLLSAFLLTFCSSVPAHAQGQRWQVASDINNALGSNAAYIEASDGSLPLWLGVLRENGQFYVVVQVKDPGCYCASTEDMERFVRLAEASGGDGLLSVVTGTLDRVIRLRRNYLGPEDDQVYEFRARLEEPELSAVSSGSRYMVRIGQAAFAFRGQGSARAIQRIRRARW